MASMEPPFVVPDLRSPGAAMRSLSLKLPLQSLAELQTMADLLKCNRGSLARALLLQGLQQLQRATTAQGLAP